MYITAGDVGGGGGGRAVGREDETGTEVWSTGVGGADFRGGGTSPGEPWFPFAKCACGELGAQLVAGEVGEEAGRSGGVAFNEVAGVVGTWVDVGEGGAPGKGVVCGVDEDVEEDAALVVV